VKPHCRHCGRHEAHGHTLTKPVGRLDLVHQALREAYLRGRSDVRLEAQEICTRAAQRFADAAQRMAQVHAEEFVAAVTERATAEAERAALPWSERLRAV
jgi:hypothetical protein